MKKYTIEMLVLGKVLVNVQKFQNKFSCTLPCVYNTGFVWISTHTIVKFLVPNSNDNLHKDMFVSGYLRIQNTNIKLNLSFYSITVLSSNTVCVN